MIDNLQFTVYAKKLPHGYVGLYMHVRNEAYRHLKKPGRYQKDIPLRIKILPEKWGGGNDVPGQDRTWILGNDEESIKKNLEIRNLQEEIRKVYWKIKNLTEREPEASQIIDVFKSKNFPVKQRTRLLEFIPQYCEGNNLVFNTAKNYIYSLTRSLKGFFKAKYNSEDFYLDEVDTTFMYRYEMYLFHSRTRNGKRYQPGSIQEYINKVKAVMAYAKKIGEVKGDVLADYHPNVFKKESPVVVSSLHEAVAWKISPADLKKIEEVQIEGYAIKGDAETSTGNQFNYDLHRARKLFLFQTWTGFAYSDLAVNKDVRKLIMKDLTKKDSIIYNRAKNGELAIIPLFEQTKRLLEALDYDVTPQSSYDTYRRKIKALMNYYVIKCDEPGTHLGRHIFGCRMLTMGFSMESISRMMGHTSISMTEKVYARIDINKINADYERIQATKELGNRIAV